MKYAVSDIHGRFDKYESMLKIINLSDEDELYVIGDVIDRGPDGIKILKDIMKRSNVHMLLGNHELMAVETILATDEESKLENLDLWMWNGGNTTLQDLLALDEEERERIVSFLSSLPVSMEVEAGGQKFYLVHGFPADEIKEQVWARPNLDTPNPFKDCILVIGHTPVSLLHENANRNISGYINYLNSVGGHFKIEHADGFIDIDCGCCYELPGVRLGCLRLDDMEEFYV